MCETILEVILFENAVKYGMENKNFTAITGSSG